MNDGNKKIAIAAAANLQFVIPELTEAFTNETGIGCTVSISSSGKLTAQITEGAPFDLFLSADMYYPNYLFQQGFGSKEPEVYAKGILVLWSMKEINLTLEGLTDPEIKHIAIANPELAPYGIPVKELLIKKGDSKIRIPFFSNVRSSLIKQSIYSINVLRIRNMFRNLNYILM